MSLLYRFAKLSDRLNTHIFTFIVTKSVTRDLHRDVTSKEFMYGHQKWAITFSRTEKVLGVYLVWRNPSESMKVYIDFSFTLLNRQHFTANESFTGKHVKFTYDCPAQGNRRYIPVSDLYSRNFADPNGEFQLELTMSNIRTHYEADLRVPPFLLTYPNKFMHSGHRGPPPRLESTYFNFGGFDWNVTLYPFGKEPGGDEKLFVYLNRLTGFDHQCRIRYLMILGEGDRTIQSGLLDDISDTNGICFGWKPRTRINDIISAGVIHISLEMVTANTLSEVALVPNVPNPAVVPLTTVSPSPSTPMGENVLVQCYDREKQSWTLEADTNSDTLRVRMVYKDVHNVPRNHLRYVSWNAYLLRYNNKTGLLDPITCTYAPYSHYYVQEETDDGIIMETDVTVKEIREPSSFYLNDKQQVRVQIEWGESFLLFQATYQKYDDLVRVHGLQMRKEISALQAENYYLERQLFSYQKSIEMAHHHAHPSNPNSPRRSRNSSGRAEGHYEDAHEEVVPIPPSHPPSSYMVRGASTDTEYA